MLLANPVKDFPRRAGAAVGGVIKALADCLVYVSAGGDVEQTLICFGVLNDCFGFAFNRKDDGSLALFELLHEVATSAPKGRERLDVFRDIKHGLSFKE
jgi:hypothetical protein